MKLGTPQTKVNYGSYANLLKLCKEPLVEDDWEGEQDVEIVTLKQHLYDKAAEEAWDVTSNFVAPNLEEDIDAIAGWLVEEKYTHAKEFISYGEDRITVGVNAEKIDNDAVEYALQLLSKVDHLKGFSTIEFGELIEVYEPQT